MPNRMLLLTLASGVLFPLALPNEIFPLGSPLLGLVALLPLYAALCETPQPRAAARLMAVFGAVSTVLSNYWLMFFGDYSVWTIGGTTIGYVAYNYVLGGFLWWATRTRRAYRPILFALVWTLYEYLKSTGFLAYPWGLAAYPFNTVPLLIQFADVTGVWGLSLLAVYANAALGELVLCVGRTAAGRWPAREALVNAAGCALLVLGVAAYGHTALRTDVPVRDRVRVLLVQQNADAWNTDNVARPLLTAQEETARGLAAAPGEVDLVVWSETSLRYFFEEARPWYAGNPESRPFLEFLSDLPAPLMTGAPMLAPEDPFAIYNAVLLIERDGTVGHWYAKQHLVPFAELIPFWDAPLVRRFFEEVIGIPGIWAPGPGYRLIPVPTASGSSVSAGAPVCFEDAMAYVVRGFVLAGADLLVNLTNNAWSRTDSAQYQHFVAARFRAVETRRSLVRSTNAGLTAVVDPWGHALSRLPMFETDSLYAEVAIHVPRRETFYVRHGDFLPQVIAGLLALLFGVSVLKDACEAARVRRGAG